MKFVFVILHYLALEDTKECVDSIMQSQKEEYYIVIVDNCSPNDSFDKLYNEYHGFDNIHLIQSNKNAGFAVGNNLGYRYAKEVLNADFVICINNDTILNQDEFLTILENEFNENHFYVMGPDIITVSGKVHQNPAHCAGLSKTRLSVLLLNKRMLLKRLNKDGSEIINKIIYKITSMIYTVLSKVEERMLKSKFPILHGACLIFSPSYITANNNAFDEHTFLYFEEDILHYTCMKKNWLMVYQPRAVIYHKEDAATNLACSTKEERSAFKTKHFINSGKYFLSIMGRKK